MTKTYVTDVKRGITKKELVNKIKDKKVEARMPQRLLFIKYLYEGDSVPEAADKVEVTFPPRTNGESGGSTTVDHG